MAAGKVPAGHRGDYLFKTLIPPLVEAERMVRSATFCRKAAGTRCSYGDEGGDVVVLGSHHRDRIPPLAPSF